MIQPRPLPRAGLPVRPLVIVVALVGLALAVGLGQVPMIGARVSGQGVLVAIGAAVVLGLITQRLEWGVLLMPITAVIVPFALGTGTETSIPAALILAAGLLALWVARMLIRRDLTIAAPSVTLPLVAFNLAASLATVYSDVERDPLVWVPATWTQIQLGGLSVFILSAAVLLVTANVIRDILTLKRLVWIFLALGSVAYLVYVVRGGDDLPGMSIGGLFSMWVIALAFGQAAFNGDLSPRQRLFLAGLAAAWLGRRFTLENDWLSGWVPAAVAILVICLARSRRLFFLAILGIGLVALIDFDSIYSTQVEGDNAEGNFLRVQLWEQSLSLMKRHFLLGTGVVGYAPYYMTFFPDAGWSTHSNYLDLIAETGLVGSLLFVWLVIALFLVGLAARRQWRTGFAAGYANGALGGLIGMLVAMAFGDWLIPFVYNQTIGGFRYTVHSWLFLGALVAMRRLAPEPAPAPE